MSNLATKILNNIIENENCWEWTGSFISKTPILYNNNVKKLVFELFKDKVLPKYVRIGHNCNNYKCVNPDHLYIKTCPKKVPVGSQTNKRKVQNRLNKYINSYENIKGSIIILSGTKVYNATNLYFTDNIANEILIVEKNIGSYIIIKDLLKTQSKYYNNVFLWPEPSDVTEVSTICNKVEKDKWKGFDFDFDTTFMEENLFKIKNLIDNINSSIWWLRITSTLRSGEKNTKKKVINRFNSIANYIRSNNKFNLLSYVIESYIDSVPMLCMQIIVSKT